MRVATHRFLIPTTHGIYLPWALFFAAVLLFSGCRVKQKILQDPSLPLKREVRAAWLPTVFRTEYSTPNGKQILEQRIRNLAAMGCNVIIFQVRPESDAFYRSDIEPWSRFLSGIQGVAPTPEWDPLQTATELCHQSGMELHAWINPYRAATRADQYLAPGHPHQTHPEWFVTYNNQLLYNPALPESRRHICRVVRDVVMRYDVDAIHLDDYFYPYPVTGLPFPDEADFQRYGIPQGYTAATKEDWRRHNVNMLMRDLKTTLLTSKPWVRLGISPFGIYRNKRSWNKGSETSGLQNYDDLYADVLAWIEAGWVDYIAPQVYWNAGHRAADYDILTSWWGAQRRSNTQLYIGQDVKRTMEGGQLAHKLTRSRIHSQGNIWWPAEELFRNTGGVADSLRNSYQRYRAIPHAFNHMYRKAPKPIPKLYAEWTPQGYYLMWEDIRRPEDPVMPYYYALYAFPKGIRVNIRDSRYLVQISPTAYYRLPYRSGKQKYTYVVTTLNRFWNESKPRRITVRL